MPLASPPDRVMMTVDGTIGDLTMTGAVAGFRTIQQAVADGHYTWGTETYWVAEDDGQNGTTAQAEWFSAVVLENSTGDPVLVRTGGTLLGKVGTAGATGRLEFAGSGLTRVFGATPEAVRDFIVRSIAVEEATAFLNARRGYRFFMGLS